MEHPFPCPIESEQDLNQYEVYLKESGTKPEQGLCLRGMRVRGSAPACGPGMEMRIEDGRAARPETALSSLLCDRAFFSGYLHDHIGKLVKVESQIADRLECRVGTLLHVGADHIVLKLFESCCTMICDVGSIKYITVIHDNDRRKTE